jgi:signal peptidase I
MSAYTRAAVIRSVELASQSASAAVRAGLSRGLTSLASIAATASFVGFFGTVLGLLNSFQSMRGSRSAALADVASRISDAMVPGILGLFVAVIAFWFHQYLRYQLQAFDLEMQNASVDLVNRLIVHLERLRTDKPTVWKELTGVSSKAAAHLEAIAERVLDGPRLVWEPMYRHGLLELIWPRLKSEFDATPALDTAAWVCFGCSILGWLAYRTQHRLVAGFLVLAFLVVAGAAIRRGLRVGVVVTLAYFLTVVCASICSYKLTFTPLCVAVVLFPLGGALRAVRWRAPIRPMRRSLRYGWSLLVISSGLAATNAALFGTVFGLFHTEAADDSMQPTIHAGDWVVGLNAPIAGPIQRNQVWGVNWGGLVGDVRVVGLPGDRLRIRKGVLVLNGKPLREPYCTPYPEASGDFPLPSRAYSDMLLRAYHEVAYLGKLENAIEYVVPPGYYFVLNDNRKQLSDSRTMGPVPRDQFVARLMVACGSGVRVFTLGQVR